MVVFMAAIEELFYCGDAIENLFKAAIEKEYKIFFYCAFSIAAAAVACRRGCRSPAAFVAAAVILWRNRSAFIRPGIFLR